MANQLAIPASWSNPSATTVWNGTAWVTDYTQSGGNSCNMQCTGSISVGDTFEGTASVIAAGTPDDIPFHVYGGGYLNFTSPSNVILWSSSLITDTAPFTFAVPAVPGFFVFTYAASNPYGAVTYTGILTLTPVPNDTPFWDDFVGTFEVLP